MHSVPSRWSNLGKISPLRKWLIDYPAAAITWLWWAYWTLIAAAAIVCFTTVALCLVLWALGIAIL